ncbi:PHOSPHOLIPID:DIACYLGLYCEROL ACYLTRANSFERASE 1, phospholipid:diacylglycerol acyltransferase [Hibiscus trionum]|uniref:phospholipid:diacylglycerol acyltransferase n=2 Tax=Hibiscus trionum TaxID=183268 RepID=A0A9W7HTE2_HIBTR|nr:PHOSPHOLIPID:DIACYLGLYCEROL ACYLTRANSFERASE 1, phospholipid:diacylglycerol acyltransferase [Hibiscus trionum]
MSCKPLSFYRSYLGSKTMSFLRRRKVPDSSKPPISDPSFGKEDDKKNQYKSSQRRSYSSKNWSCWDNCCWFIGVICSVWWFLLFLYNATPDSIPQYVSMAITGPLPDPPGVKLKKEGLTANHPVVLVPGIVTGGLELWEGRQCAEGLLGKRLWGGSFGEFYKRPLCWLEHISLDNETGLDPPGIRVRPVSGLVAADYFARGYFVWAVIIANLAHIGYEEKSLHMVAYDWRLSFQNTEVRDQSLSRIKSNIELLVATHGGKKVVVVPHSMGVQYFLHFMKWVEAPAPMGGGGGSDWCAKHIKAVMNVGAPFLGSPKSTALHFSIEVRDIANLRAQAPGFLDKDVFGLQTFKHLMRMFRTWDATFSMVPKGGETIWGGLDWSPEMDSFDVSVKKGKENITHNTGQNTKSNVCNTKGVNYGRLISFGKEWAETHSSKFERADFKNIAKGDNVANSSNCDIWLEYHEMGNKAIKAVEDHKVYTAGSILDLLHYVAPKLMARGASHFSYGIADNLDDPKYGHYKYWSNPLETKLPNAPDMEIYSLYGVGLSTERGYIYKVASPSDCHIPFQIDTSVDGDSEDSCLKDGVFSGDGDETVPVISAGFMGAKGWRGKTRFNPSGIHTYIREYNHAPPANLLEGRGTQSGSHVDLLGNFALIEDVLRVAAGASGEDLGGDRVYTDIFKWSERINLQL